MRGPAAKYATLAGVVSLVGVMGLLPMWLRNKMGARPASADGGFARCARLAARHLSPTVASRDARARRRPSPLGSPISASEKCLTGSQIQRGQFMNSGSKDAGPDARAGVRTSAIR